MAQSNQNTNNENTQGQNLNDVEFWRSIGIEPIVVDENDPNYIEKTTEQVVKAIEQVAKQLKNET